MGLRLPNDGDSTFLLKGLVRKPDRGLRRGKYTRGNHGNMGEPTVSLSEPQKGRTTGRTKVLSIGIKTKPAY